MFKSWILALDFDGVVWDSVGECFHTACVTYQNLYGVDCSGLEKPFRAGRWLVRCGGDFYLVIKLALENPERDWEQLSKADFEREKNADAEHYHKFEAEFYRVRSEFQTRDPSGWAALQSPYAAFGEQFPQFQAAFQEVVLLTTKDQQSANLLLATAGIKMSIWGREHGTHKGGQMADLCQKRQISAQQVVFIDDLIDNLNQVRPSGARCFLASWGYNTPGEQAEARREGYAVLAPQGLLAQLESWRSAQVA